MNPTNQNPDRKCSPGTDLIGELLGASSSFGRVMQVGAAQYQTPKDWALRFNNLLPRQQPATVFDPQCAGGNLFEDLNWGTARFGWDIDHRFRENQDKGISMVEGNCVQFWELLDELWPELRFECQVANPPFSIPWKTAQVSVDSTAYTWQKIIERTAAGGSGYFIGNLATIERLKIHEHPWCYLYHRVPVGMFPEANVEIGVVHFWERHVGGDPVVVDYDTADIDDPPMFCTVRELRQGFSGANNAPSREGDGDRPAGSRELADVWQKMRDIVAEESRTRPPFNIYLDRKGMLKTHLSIRHQVQRKVSRAELAKLARLEGVARRIVLWN